MPQDEQMRGSHGRATSLGTGRGVDTARDRGRRIPRRQLRRDPQPVLVLQ